MKDLEPTGTPKHPGEFKNPVKEIPGIDEFADFLRRHRVYHKIVNLTITSLFYISLIVTPGGIEMLRNPESRRFIFSRSSRVGLLEDSVFNHELYYPNQDGTSLNYKSAVAGR